MSDGLGHNNDHSAVRYRTWQLSRLRMSLLLCDLGHRTTAEGYTTRDAMNVMKA
jgi:hypothetical protein